MPPAPEVFGMVQTAASGTTRVQADVTMGDSWTLEFLIDRQSLGDMGMTSIYLGSRFTPLKTERYP